MLICKHCYLKKKEAQNKSMYIISLRRRRQKNKQTKS